MAGNGKEPKTRAHHVFQLLVEGSMNCNDHTENAARWCTIRRHMYLFCITNLHSLVRRKPSVIALFKCIGVNRPAFGGTVPHFHQMSRGPAKSADVPHFSNMVLLFFSLPIILHVCLATQQSDELRIKIGKDRFKIRTPTGH